MAQRTNRLPLAGWSIGLALNCGLWTLVWNGSRISPGATLWWLVAAAVLFALVGGWITQSLSMRATLSVGAIEWLVLLVTMVNAAGNDRLWAPAILTAPVVLIVLAGRTIGRLHRQRIYEAH